MPSCITCGADWKAGGFTSDCAECGGGPLARDCPRCGGRCGARWERAIVGSNDSGEAHWIGHCGLGAAEAAALDEPCIEWWLDDSALPNLLWACLLTFSDGRAKVVDLDGAEHPFADYQSAQDWLRADEYDRLAALREAGEVDHKVRPPGDWKLKL